MTPTFWPLANRGMERSLTKGHWGKNRLGERAVPDTLSVRCLLAKRWRCQIKTWRSGFWWKVQGADTNFGVIAKEPRYYMRSRRQWIYILTEGGPKSKSMGTSSFRSQLKKNQLRRLRKNNIKRLWYSGSQVKKVLKRGRREWLYHMLMKDQIRWN